MPAYTLTHYLHTASELRTYAQHAGNVAELQRALASILPPPLCHGAQPACLNGGTLLITADNGAIAAKLKQLTPDLLFKLKNQGHKLSAIRIAVQVRAYPAARSATRPCSTPAPEPWRALADGLEPGPLKNAIDRMLTRCS